MKILRFWGIPIHKILSDDDFVERAQKHLKQSKKYAWVYVAMLLMACFWVPKLIQALLGLIKEMPNNDLQMLGAGLMVGILFGTIVAQYLVHVVQAILMALDLFEFNRSSKLLIKYHNMLKENGLLEEGNEQQDGQIFAEEKMI